MKRSLLLAVALLACALLAVSAGGYPVLGEADTPVAVVAKPDLSRPFAAGEVVIQYRPSLLAAERGALLADYSLDLVRPQNPGSPLARLAVPAGAEIDWVERLAGDRRVAYAFPNYIEEAILLPDEEALADPPADPAQAAPAFTPNDPYYGTLQPNFPQINVHKAWDFATSAVTVAVIDTGLDLAGTTHPDFNCTSKLVAGYDFYDNDSNPHDGHGHGTHVAGIVGACTNNSTGVAGVARNARIMPLRTLGDSGSGFISYSMDALRWAADHGARVINMSLGGTLSDPSAIAAYQSAVDYAYGHGLLVVAAAGNNYETGNPVFYPAALNNVMAVASIGLTNIHAPYSETGYFVDIAAPGGGREFGSADSRSSITSTYVRSKAGNPATGYGRMAGTSQASPHVAGAAAVLWGINPGLTNAQVDSILRSTADDLGAAGRDDVFGAGRVDVEAAGLAAGGSPPATATATATPRPPTLAVSPGALNFLASPFFNAAPASVSVLNVGNGTLSWTASESATWLSLSPGSGLASPGMPGAFTVTANKAGLAYGIYTTNITVTSATAGVAGSPQVITVRFSYTASPRRIYLPLILKAHPTPGATATPTRTATPPSGGWTTIASQDFEGASLTPWTTMDDDGPANGEYLWARRTCRFFAGGYSGWPVGGGAQGSGLACGTNYPSNTVSWLIYGPFSTSGTTAANMTFKLWLNSEKDYDSLCRLASLDGVNFSGWCTSGQSGGWVDSTLDLANIPEQGSYLGKPNVWVALVFESDSSITYPEGAYVDNVLVRKCTGSCPAGGTDVETAAGLVEKPVHLVR